jgi:hypothetical protein
MTYDPNAQYNTRGERLAYCYGYWIPEGEARRIEAQEARETKALEQRNAEQQTREYSLNRKSLERMKALIRSGKFIDVPWSFTVEDSNALLGDEPNYTEYLQWFLGQSDGTPNAGTMNPDFMFHKFMFAYPYGKQGVVNLAALRKIISIASKKGENDIADAATKALAMADGIEQDKRTASGAACNRNVIFAAYATTIAAGAGSEKKIPTFTADAYTGVPMTIEGWTHQVVIDLAGLDYSTKPRPVLRDHDAKRPIGHTTSIGVVDGILKVEGEISVVSQDAQEVIDSGKNNFPYQVSVGCSVVKSQFVMNGDIADANGRSWQGPVNIARQTNLREISFLSLGADDATSAKIAATAKQNLEEWQNDPLA